MINPTPYSNLPLLNSKNPPVNINPGYPSQSQIYAKPSSSPSSSPSPPPYQNALLPPQNYQLLPNPVLINQPMVMPQYNYIQPKIVFPKTLDMSELYEDLAEVREAEVWKYFQGGVLGFGKAQKYRVRIRFPEGNERNIFIGKRSSSFFHNNTYDFEIRMKYIPRDSTDDILNTKDFEKRHFDIDSNDMYGYKPKVFITFKENNRNIIYGGIEQPRCCTCCCRDPNFQLFPRYLPGLLPKYFVTTDGCQCSYCCCSDCSCAEVRTVFPIFDIARNVIVGNITKTDFNRMKNDFLVYSMEFPIEAPPEDKLIIIFTAITIDNIEYQDLGKHIK